MPRPQWVHRVTSTPATRRQNWATDSGGALVGTGAGTSSAAGNYNLAWQGAVGIGILAGLFQMT
ncbi:MAG: hypothetical protein ABI630_11490, partial [Betaproteobacteria bacterium]